MNFKAYDIFSSLIPGFIILIVILDFLDWGYNKDYILPYTAFAFLLGYCVNSICSWLEDFYYWTWRGKPSVKLLEGKQIWKVKFHQYAIAKELLIKDCKEENPTNDYLFSLAKLYVIGNKDSRVEDFNMHYAFSRSLLTTVLISTILLLIKNYDEISVYFITIPLLLGAWLRSKQRAYYYAREY